MLTLIRNSARYDQVLYDDEAQFEQIVCQAIPILLPHLHVLPFKVNLLPDEGRRRRPDLAFVHTSLRYWAIVEVELEHHSLRQHVMPQIEAFCTAEIRPEHADYLADQLPSVQRDEIRRMMRYVPPTTIVVVNDRAVLDRGWGALETEYGAKISFLETFRSLSGDPVFAFSGYEPKVADRLVSSVRKSRTMNALLWRDQSTLPPLLSTIALMMGGRMTEWRVVRTATEAILVPLRPVTLEARRNYEVRQRPDGVLQLFEL